MRLEAAVTAFFRAVLAVFAVFNRPASGSGRPGIRHAAIRRAAGAPWCRSRTCRDDIGSAPEDDGRFDRQFLGLQRREKLRL